MLAHHQVAVAIANVEVARGQDPELTELARKTIKDLREIRAMRARLRTLSGPAIRRLPPPVSGDRARSGSPDMPGIDASGSPAARTR